ncbi:MAG: PilZ domain-containing protein [Nitrospinota bacterium]
MEEHKYDNPHDTSEREAVRVNTSFKIEFRRVPESELHDVAEEITSHRTNDRLGFPPPEAELPADLDNLKDYQETTPYIMKMWVSIEQKLNVLMKLAGDKAHGIPNAEKGIVKDISAKGVKMKTEADLNKGEYLMLRISPPTFPSFILDAVGKVLSSDPAGKSARHCKVEFTALNPDDREILIAYVFKRQREILRSRLEDETIRKEKGEKADG